MILLDTHVVRWALEDIPRLGRQARRTIQNADIRYISAITHVEIAIKSGVSDVRAPVDLAEVAVRAGMTPLPFEDRHAKALGRFPQLARHDPFDRMLLAQADVDRLAFVTADQKLLALDQSWIIDATQ